jgi:hypothetical protein
LFILCSLLSSVTSALKPHSDYEPAPDSPTTDNRQLTTRGICISTSRLKRMGAAQHYLPAAQGAHPGASGRAVVRYFAGVPGRCGCDPYVEYARSPIYRPPSLSVPALKVCDLFDWPPAALPGRGLQCLWVRGVAERYEHAQMQVVGIAQQLA